MPVGATRWYGHEIVAKLVTWFWGVLDSVEAEIACVAHAELFTDFVCANGEVGPVNREDGKMVPPFLYGSCALSLSRRERGGSPRS